jgi:hypothetical protein
MLSGTDRQKLEDGHCFSKVPKRIRMLQFLTAVCLQSGSAAVSNSSVSAEWQCVKAECYLRIEADFHSRITVSRIR